MNLIITRHHPFTIKLAILIFAFLLCACGDNGDSSSNGTNNSNVHDFVRTLSFPDSVLQDCVEAAVQKNKWTSYSEITRLECDGANMGDAEGIDQLPALTNLRLQDNRLTSIDVSKNTALTNLDLSSNNLTSVDVTNNIKLTKLNVAANQLTDIDLSLNLKLTSLWLSGNQLTDIDVSNNAALEILSAYGNDFTSIDLSNNTALAYLDLSGGQVSSNYFDHSVEIPINDGKFDLIFNIPNIEPINIPEPEDGSLVIPPRKGGGFEMTIKIPRR